MNDIEYVSRFSGGDSLAEFLQSVGYIEKAEDMANLTMNDFRNIVHIITNGAVDLPPFDQG